MRGLQEMGPLFPGIAERFTTLQAYALAQLDGAVDFKGNGRRGLFAAMGFPLLGEPCDAVAEDWNGDGVSDRVVSEADGGLQWIQSRKANGRSAGEPSKTGERAREPQPEFRLRTPGRATGRAKS